MSTKPTLTRWAGLLAASAMFFAACTTANPGSGASAGAGGGGMDALIAAAKAEGGLTTIALPHTWCNYGEMLTSFTTKSASRSTN